MNILQDHVLRQGFTSPAEEILFFKKIKPDFYSRLIYYQKVYNLEIDHPAGSPDDQKTYFQKEFEKVKHFFNDHKFWYQYYRSDETYLDEKLFLRNREKSPFYIQLFDLNAHPSFTTHIDYIFSHIIANELLVEYLQNALLELNPEKNILKASTTLSDKKVLKWTDSKSALIELAYAFKAKGIFNNGNATLKEITDHLQQVFDIQLTNPSRDFQEILRRKTGYTIFLDSLRDSYLHYIDIIENKDR